MNTYFIGTKVNRSMDKISVSWTKKIRHMVFNELYKKSINYDDYKRVIQKFYDVSL